MCDDKRVERGNIVLPSVNVEPLIFRDRSPQFNTGFSEVEEEIWGKVQSPPENVSVEETVGDSSDDVSVEETVRDSSENVSRDNTGVGWVDGFEVSAVSDKASGVGGNVDDWGGDDTGKTVNRWDGVVFVADLWSDEGLDAVAGLGNRGRWDNAWDERSWVFNDSGLDVGVWGLEGRNSTRDSVDGVDGVEGGEGVKSTEVSGGVDGVDGVKSSEVSVVDGVKSKGSNGVASSDGSDGVDGVDGVASTKSSNSVDGVASSEGSNSVDGVASSEGSNSVDGVASAEGSNGVKSTEGSSVEESKVVAWSSRSLSNHKRGRL
ncbi:hypothetical protein RUM44_007052 [Polyplax serrata]|uniref:Uncharacterized protein n=1 Tax=Polyplax serrata TaxID=468196 RepID=A0ABR1AZL5_POLSC